MAHRFHIGLDLGQARDFTALVVAEKIPPELEDSYELHIRHIERFKDTLYPDVVARVRELMDIPPIRGDAALAVDATGVGVAVVDMLRMGGLDFDAVTITAGDSESVSGYRNWRVPKRDLVSNLQVLLQTGRLKIASRLEHASTLRTELLNFRVKVNIATAHDSYEAWREGDHDDLVLAAALAAWKAKKGEFTLLIGRA